MNFIWYPLIEAIQDDYDTTKIRYRVCDKEFQQTAGGVTIRRKAGAHHMSPLLEYLPLVLYDQDKTTKNEDKFSRVDINPYFRFGDIFNHILSPERNDPNDLIICDIITHALAEIDRICGMSKHDFKVLLVMAELKNGCFGGSEDGYQLFSPIEKRAVAEALIKLYETSKGLRCLDNLLKTIMPDFKLRNRDQEEIIFYNPAEFDEQQDKKLRFIIKLFLPLNFPYIIQWRYTYGTIDHDPSMLLEEFVL